MVGVPGRSKACTTCKKRRIQCDLDRPTCGQCTRSKRDCSYPAKHIFVHHEGNHKTVYRKEDRSPTTEALKPSSDVSQLPDDGSVRLTEQDTVTIFRPFGTLTALSQRWLAEASDAPVTLLSTDQNVPRPWTYTISAFAGSVHALNSAPLSCYTAWIGRRRRERYLVEASRRLYIEGLKEVQAAVNDPASALRDETFGACLALIVYEALECPDRSRTGFSAHVAGCARIVKMRGAGMHQHGAAHDLFRAFRYIAVSRSLLCQACCLDETLTLCL